MTTKQPEEPVQPKPAREKNPRYDIYELVTIGEGENANWGYVLSAEAVAAPSRKAAIATGRNYGTFLVVRHGEAAVITREQATVVQDVWTT